MILNRVLYLILTLITVFLSMVYGGKGPIVLTYGLLVLPIISYAYTLLSVRFVTFTRISDKERIVKGDTVHIYLNFENRSPLIFPYMHAYIRTDTAAFVGKGEDMCFCMYPFQKCSVELTLRCKYRGRYTAGLDKLECHDPLGLFTIRRKYYKNNTILVYPRIVPLDSQYNGVYSLIADMPTRNSSAGEDYSSVRDLRGARNGDSLRRVHWKLSAKKNELIIKQYEPSVRNSCLILLDMSSVPYSGEQKLMVEDILIEGATAVTRYFTDNSLPVVLSFMNGGQVFEYYDMRALSFDVIYDALAHAEFGNTDSYLDFVKLCFNPLHNKDNIYLFTADMGAALTSAAGDASAEGYSVILVHAGLDPNGETASADDIGFPICYLLPDSDVKTALEV